TSFVEKHGFSTVAVTTANDGRNALRSTVFDVVLIDVVLPGASGIDLLLELPRERRPEVILMSGAPGVRDAFRDALLQEIHFVQKPLDMQLLADLLAKIRRRSRREQPDLRSASGVDRLLGQSEAIARIRELIIKVAPTDLSVYIEGESGTGKELVARAVHDLSKRSGQPYVALNCGAIPETLIDSELFGHERGAFTGATGQKEGVFEQANGGTLFLDEVTEMPTDLQVRLLRTLETSLVRRVGGRAEIQVDVRVIAATNRSFHKAIADGKLREDLFHRLCVFPITIPPLRERRVDVPLLANHFLSALNSAAGTDKSISPAAMEVMCGYSWPGNVRQLRNVVQQAYVIANDVIDVDSLPTYVRTDSLPDVPQRATPARQDDAEAVKLDVGITIAEAERRLIEATLRKYGGHKQAAADALGVSVRTLYYRLNQYSQEAERGGHDRAHGSHARERERHGAEEDRQEA
ncbi:MAG TPA: sigma-54 dependent transcriptional regulator, partial [Planctomycetota bacterium]|nr:sigma-54 dependent transcriptional regulator [Planctomycetota bacterium]